MTNFTNQFIKENIMGAGTSFTENGAVSYATTGSNLIDQFFHAGTARGRDLGVVWNEQAQLWAESPINAVRFPFYLRMVTRKSKYGNGNVSEKVQKGQGARDEAFKRLLWIAKYHPETFYANLWLVPVVGSWKDLWVMLSMGEEYLDKGAFWDILVHGLTNENTTDLVKKYLPRIRSTKKCTTDWSKSTNRLAKEFMSTVGLSFSEYRKLKASGTAHDFQKFMCGRKYSKINWGHVPGKALLNIVSSKFLDNHNLVNKYLTWLETQDTVKFNGYPFELGHKVDSFGYNGPSRIQKYTIDKQFESLIKTGSADNAGITGNVLCALDTSGSMGCSVNNAGVTSYDVCASLGIYFSELNKGAFHNTVAMFDNTSRMLALKGTFTEKWNQIKHEKTALGGTNFQSLIDLICETRQNHPEIPLEDYPTTLLVVSDMQFNSCGRNTNFEATKRKLLQYFSQEFVDNFKLVWWFCAGRSGATNDVPSTMEHSGTYFFSGFDGSVISFLLGGEVKTDKNGNIVQPTSEEIIQEALNQEVLQKAVVLK